MRGQSLPLRDDPRARLRGWAVSLSVHLLLLVALLGVRQRSPQLAAFRLPGTRTGLQLLTYYAPGSRPTNPGDRTAKAAIKPHSAPLSSRPTPVPPAAAMAETPHADTGSGSAAESSQGDGDINIALQKFFPHPAPDLSSLPRGAKGDVILDALIDRQGRIARLTLLQGLGAPIDDQVIAVVREWVYTPATRNGSPVPSEQELHFHYERRG